MSPVPERVRVEAVHDPEMPIAVPHSLVVDSQVMPRHLRIAPRHSRLAVASQLIVRGLRCPLSDSRSSATRSQRYSSNMIWSPIPRLELVAEFLYGVRVNADQHRPRARQIQIGSTFRF